jgi:hypothetical protein
MQELFLMSYFTKNFGFLRDDMESKDILMNMRSIPIGVFGSDYRMPSAFDLVRGLQNLLISIFLDHLGKSPL